jgi:type IV secretory pathway VirJ component
MRRPVILRWRRIVASMLACAVIGAAAWSSLGPSDRVASDVGRARRGSSSADGTSVSDLPTIEVPAAGGGRVLAVLMTGDGGWAVADRGLSRALAARGVPVVGLDAPRYLARGRAPDEVGHDLALILDHYLAAWGAERAVVVGYSRGADIVPFMVARLSPALRRRVALVVLLGPSESVGFRFHVVDLVANVRRSGDLSVRAEIQRLRGTPVLCIYGRSDRDAICPSLDTTLARPVLRDGGHAVGGSEGSALAGILLRAVASTK